MANKPLSMIKIRQVLLFLERGASQRTIEKEVRISRRTIAGYLLKFTQTGVDFKELLKRSDQELEQILGLLKPVVSEDTDPRKVHFNNLIGYFSKQLNRTGVTRLLLWEEYIKEYPEGFQYSRFCELLLLSFFFFLLIHHQPLDRFRREEMIKWMLIFRY